MYRHDALLIIFINTASRLGLPKAIDSYQQQTIAPASFCNRMVNTQCGRAEELCRLSWLIYSVVH